VPAVSNQSSLVFNGGAHIGSSRRDMSSVSAISHTSEESGENPARCTPKVPHFHLNRKTIPAGGLVFLPSGRVHRLVGTEVQEWTVRTTAERRIQQKNDQKRKSAEYSWTSNCKTELKKEEESTLRVALSHRRIFFLTAIYLVFIKVA
jgi:hypothetical protein